MTGAPARPLAFVLLGLWLGALIASWVVAAVNFRTAERALGPDSPPALQQRLAPLDAEDRRMALRHVASEINRFLFQSWAPAQLVLAAAAGLAAWPAGAWRWLLGAAALLTLAQVLLLTPPIVELGRAIDFLPRPLPPDLARRFGLLHAGYVIADLFKALLLAAGAWWLARRRRAEH